jgi:ribosomal protein S18 acetylase RimI-like enzyme
VLTFERYLASLVGSWEALAEPRMDASVVRGDGFVAAVFAEPVLNNAVLLSATGVGPAAGLYGDRPHAVWTRDGEQAVMDAVRRAGYQESETTTPMMVDLADWRGTSDTDVIVADLDSPQLAELLGTEVELLRGAPGVRAYRTTDSLSGLVTTDVGDDVNIGWVTTAPHARRGGRATAVLAKALSDAHVRGMRTASLQATDMAVSLYKRAGFVVVGRWQEWVR